MHHPHLMLQRTQNQIKTLSSFFPSLHPPACRWVGAAVGSEVSSDSHRHSQLLVGEVRGVCRAQRGPRGPDQGHWGQQTVRSRISRMLCVHVNNQWKQLMISPWLIAALRYRWTPTSHGGQMMYTEKDPESQTCVFPPGWGSVHGGQRDGARGSC